MSFPESHCQPTDCSPGSGKGSGQDLGICFSQLTGCTALGWLPPGPRPRDQGSASSVAHPSSYLAGILLALSEAGTQHVILDGFGLEDRLSIFAVE